MQRRPTSTALAVVILVISRLRRVVSTRKRLKLTHYNSVTLPGRNTIIIIIIIVSTTISVLRATWPVSLATNGKTRKIFTKELAS